MIEKMKKDKIVLRYINLYLIKLSLENTLN